MNKKFGSFIWDQGKELINIEKHGIDFSSATEVFLDSRRVIAEDVNHSKEEQRFYCFGRVGGGIMTVRFAYRDNIIRIYGAGFWRKGRKIYEEQNKIY